MGYTISVHYIYSNRSVIFFHISIFQFDINVRLYKELFYKFSKLNVGYLLVQFGSCGNKTWWLHLIDLASKGFSRPSPLMGLVENVHKYKFTNYHQTKQLKHSKLDGEALLSQCLSFAKPLYIAMSSEIITSFKKVLD